VTSFAKFLIDKWRARGEGWDGAHGLPIKAIEGTYWSTLTGSDPPSVEIDWDKLQEEIATLETEFKAQTK
jgi:hypothetical protein